LIGRQYPGDENGTAHEAGFFRPHGVVVNDDGTIYVADGDRLRAISPHGNVTTIASRGHHSHHGDGQLGPLALDHSNGNLYVGMSMHFPSFLARAANGYIMSFSL
jgi:DNA-binding beta-propeller fold protein YncE